MVRGARAVGQAVARGRLVRLERLPRRLGVQRARAVREVLELVSPTLTLTLTPTPTPTLTLTLPPTLNLTLTPTLTLTLTLAPNLCRMWSSRHAPHGGPSCPLGLGLGLG